MEEEGDSEEVDDMGRLKKYLAYKPQHHENPFLFWTGRILHTFQQDYYEYGVKPEYYEAGAECSLTSIEKALYQDIQTYWTDKEPDGKKAPMHIKSFQNGRHAHNTLATKTFCKSMAYRYELTKKEKYLKALCEGADYLVLHKCDCGLYKYQLPIGLAQDEGPTTAGVIQVLCEVYKYTGKEKYLREAIAAGNAAHEKLYDPQLGYRHTLGYEVQTTNINSSFAHSFAMLYDITKEKIWKDRVFLCMDKILELQNEEGMFFYTNVRKTIFISLYHYMVVNAILQACDLCQIQDNRIQNCVDRAITYGKKLVDEEGYVLEPDRPEVYSDFHSCTRAAVMFALAGEKESEARIVKKIGSFFHDGVACTTIDRNGRLSDGSYWYRRERHLIDAYCDVAQLMLING